MRNHYRGHKMSLWLNLIPQLHRPGGDDLNMRHHHFQEEGAQFYEGEAFWQWSLSFLYSQYQQFVCIFWVVICTEGLDKEFREKYL